MSKSALTVSNDPNAMPAGYAELMPQHGACINCGAVEDDRPYYQCVNCQVTFDGRCGTKPNATRTLTCPQCNHTMLRP